MAPAHAGEVKRRVGLVGKGLTFDAGGALSLFPPTESGALFAMPCGIVPFAVATLGPKASQLPIAILRSNVIYAERSTQPKAVI